ncbi:LamB/YcsF family protein [Oceanispirochaeta crateris]|uniref:LamB/YcsF family protein n=1 Tax=Oceanispirochaeta crateris TaxID=2518645 RepID=A0A5C1QGJ6_9SPIO|nr:LamB/YcsF family protein [Oceanispirochaeta crateris]QEN06567.1 LamB/YcsF family protein [Oceanispirochaeta crateris]
MKINCDIGERGSDHPVDTALMQHIDIANIACGGHAGDNASIRAFRTLADRFDVDVTAHLSYPDKQNFGRLTMNIQQEELLHSLDHQYALMADVKTVKFHGALYNDAASDASLAKLLANWLQKNSINSIVTQFDSELALACENLGISVMAEAFAERRYALNPQNGKLSLVNRSKDYASIHELDEAVQHSLKIMNDQKVTAFYETDGQVKQKEAVLMAQTICIHSDSEISLTLATALQRAFGREKSGSKK